MEENSNRRSIKSGTGLVSPRNQKRLGWWPVAGTKSSNKGSPGAGPSGPGSWGNAGPGEVRKLFLSEGRPELPTVRSLIVPCSLFALYERVLYLMGSRPIHTLAIPVFGFQKACAFLSTPLPHSLCTKFRLPWWTNRLIQPVVALSPSFLYSKRGLCHYLNIFSWSF